MAACRTHGAGPQSSSTHTALFGGSATVPPERRTAAVEASSTWPGQPASTVSLPMLTTQRTASSPPTERMVSTSPRVVTYEEALRGEPVRTSAEQITFSERGNVQGAQFFAVAGLVYERARERGLGRELPAEWFLQDIRD